MTKNITESKEIAQLVLVFRVFSCRAAIYGNIYDFASPRSDYVERVVNVF